MKKIQLQLPKKKLKAKGASFTEEQVVKLVNQHVNELSQHFNDETGGWKLDMNFIESDIIYDLLGFHISDLVIQAISNKGLLVEYKDGKSLIRTKEEYQPIYMNEKTGKLHIITNSDDKSYLDKYKESDGYVKIGRL